MPCASGYNNYKPMTTQSADHQTQPKEIEQLVQAALAAYWHQRFDNSIIDAPERMRAVLEVVAHYLETTADND